MLGGGMREAGIIAAAGVVALNTMIDRLAEDHENARLLADGLAVIPGVEIDPSKVRTNLVFFDVTSPVGAVGLAARLREQGVLCSAGRGSSRIRWVTHSGIEREHAESA